MRKVFAGSLVDSGEGWEKLNFIQKIIKLLWRDLSISHLMGFGYFLHYSKNTLWKKNLR